MQGGPLAVLLTPPNGPNQSQRGVPMTKAKDNSTTKTNAAIHRAGARLKALIPVNARLDNERKRRYPKKEIASIDARYAKFYNPFKGFPRGKARERSAEYKKAYRKRGYEAAVCKSNRSDRELIALSKRITKMKPRGLDDLVVQLVAFDCLRVLFSVSYDNPLEDFSLHFAKVCGVKLRAPNGGE